MRWSIFATALMALAALASSAPAQIKLPVYDESKANAQNVSFQDVSDGEYHPGNLVRITQNNDPKHPVSGILVRSDPKKAVIYVRTRPGMAPRAFAVSDIKRIDKGVIRRVGTASDADAPEIRRMLIVNGQRRTVSYSAPTLSPAELNQLHQLQMAENDLARVELAARLDRQLRENDLRTLAVKRDIANQFFAQYLARYQVGADPVLSAAETWALLPSTQPTVLLEGWPNNSNVQVPTPGIVQAEGIGAPKTPTLATMLTEAQRRFLAAQSHAVYEDGQLIAVIPEDSSTQQSSAPR